MTSISNYNIDDREKSTLTSKQSSSKLLNLSIFGLFRSHIFLSSARLL